MLIPDAIDGDRAELEFVDVHGLLQPEPARVEVSSILSHDRLGAAAVRHAGHIEWCSGTDVARAGPSWHQRRERLPARGRSTAVAVSIVSLQHDLAVEFALFGAPLFVRDAAVPVRIEVASSPLPTVPAAPITPCGALVGVIRLARRTVAGRVQPRAGLPGGSELSSGETPGSLR